MRARAGVLIRTSADPHIAADKEIRRFYALD